MLATGSVTALSIDAEPGESIARGKSFVIRDTDASKVEAHGNWDGDGVSVVFSAPFAPPLEDAAGDQTWIVSFSAPRGETLKPGTYTGAVHSNDRKAGEPGIGVSGHGSGCIPITGAFTIHEISFTDIGVESLSVTFRHRCGGEAGSLYGELGFNASNGFKAAKAEPWAIDFGQADIGVTTTAKDVTVTSIGTQAVSVGAAEIVGDDPSSFLLESNGCTGVVLQPGETCVLGISARPRAYEPLSAELRIVDDTQRGQRREPLRVVGSGDVDATASIGPSRFYPIVDNDYDRLIVEGGRTEMAAVHVAIRSEATDLVVRRGRVEPATGAFRWTWNGKDEAGSLVPAGRYRVAVTLSDADLDTKVITKRITLSHDSVTWKQRSVIRSGRQFSLYARSANASISTRASRYSGGVRLASTEGLAGVVYVFPVQQSGIYDSVRFEVLGKSTNRHKAMIAIWNRALGGVGDLGHYDAARLIGPGSRWWRTSATGDLHVMNGKARATVLTWKGLGRWGPAVFDMNKVRLVYKVVTMHRVGTATTADTVSEPRLGAAAGTVASGPSIAAVAGGRSLLKLLFRANPPLLPAVGPADEPDSTGEPALTEESVAGEEPITSDEPVAGEEPTPELSQEPKPMPAEETGSQPTAEPEAQAIVEPTPEPAPPNQPPVADAGGPYKVHEGDTVKLDGSGSSDAEGKIVAYAWTRKQQLDDATKMRPLFSAIDDGTLDIELTVTDERGATDTAATKIKVRNVEPRIAEYGPFELAVGQTLALDVAIRDPGEQDSHEVAVNWGDGASGAALVSADGGSASASHDYADQGEYEATVTDDDGGARSRTSVVSVVAARLEEPAAAAVEAATD